jgi:hypothetical protein
MTSAFVAGKANISALKVSIIISAIVMDFCFSFFLVKFGSMSILVPFYFLNALFSYRLN